MKNSKIKQKILLLKVQNLDEKAFSAIYDLYVNKIYRFIYFKVPDELEAEDLTSNVFLKFWNYLNAEKSSPINNLNAFIYKIARNSIIDYYRTRNETIALDEAYLQQIQDDRADIAHKAEIDSEMEQVVKALPQIKEEYRDVITLKHIEELNTKEIAEILDKSHGAVRILLHRALKSLQQAINEQESKSNLDQ